MSGGGQTDLTIYFKKYASIDLYVNWFCIVILKESKRFDKRMYQNKNRYGTAMILRSHDEEHS